MAQVMIIDDDVVMCEMLSSMVLRTGHDASSAHTLKEGMREISSKNYDIVFLDIRMPDGSGLDVLPRIRERLPPGGHHHDGLRRPRRRRARHQERRLGLHREALVNQGDDAPFSSGPPVPGREEVPQPRRRPQVGRDHRLVPRMRSCFDILAQAANSDASVLITGETGTGKELFARAIHENSPRAKKNFVVVDCTALPKTLVESTLFGYEKGAFTGADKDQDGLVRQAHGGTLFLDEVGELPLVIQKAFLRVLQEHRFRPVGSKKEIESDFRLVAATNRNLDEMVEARHFRRDLLFRLQTFTLDLPALRERKEDIRELVMYHMAKLSERYGIGTKGFAPEFLESLIAYDWPGNVRELVNAVERALTMARHEPTLFPKHLPTQIRVSLARASVTKEAPPPVRRRPSPLAPAPLEELQGVRPAGGGAPVPRRPDEHRGKQHQGGLPHLGPLPSPPLRPHEEVPGIEVRIKAKDGFW